MAESKLACLSSVEDFVKHEYYFIVVGGGTAGLVVAARLTENPNVKVGVLEAGPAHLNDPMVMIPALYVQTIDNPEYDYKYKCVPQVGLLVPACLVRITNYSVERHGWQSHRATSR